MSGSNDNQSNSNSISIDGLAALQNYLADFSKELDDEPSSSNAPVTTTTRTTYDEFQRPVTSSYEQNYPNLVRTSGPVVDTIEGLNESLLDPNVNQFGHFLGTSNVKSNDNSHNLDTNNLIVVRQNENFNESAGGVDQVATSSYVNRDASTSSYADNRDATSSETMVVCQTPNDAQFKSNANTVLSMNNQPIILTVGGGGGQISQNNNNQQSIIIPIMSNSNVGALSTGGGNTILLPINSLISSSDGGVIELRLATTAPSMTGHISQQQQQPLIFLVNNSSNGGGISFVTMDNNSLILSSSSATSQNEVVDIPPANERMATILVPVSKTPPPHPPPSTKSTARAKSNKTKNNSNSNATLSQNNAGAVQSSPQNVFITVNAAGAHESSADSVINKVLGESMSDSVRVSLVQQTSSASAITTLQTKLPKGESFHCQFCDYSNAKRYLMLRHMKSHSEDRPHKCPVCERRFKTPNSLQNHINTHTGVRPHQCKMCDASFTTSGEMIRHVRYKHTLEKPHKCPHCDYASVELSKLKRHMRSHSGERPYQCPNCVYASPDTYKLKRHMRVHTGEKPYECDVCLQRFTQSNSLKAHKLIHAGTKPVFQCEFCPSSCGRKTDLKIHVQKLHGPVELSCKKCGVTFTDRYTFKVHMKSHDGERFRCDLCDYETSSHRHLDAHMQLHNSNKPGIACKECNLTFVNSHCLTRHWNAIHNPNYVAPEPKAKLYFCDQCPKRFYLGASLSKHIAHKHGEQMDLENVLSHQTDQSSSFDHNNYQKNKIPSSIFDMEADTDDDDDDDECVEDETLWLSLNERGGREIVVSVDDDVPLNSKSFITPSPPTKRRRPIAVTQTNKKKKSAKKRIQPEQLGLTNLRRRGRPKNTPVEEHHDSSTTDELNASLSEINSSQNYRTTATEDDDERAKDVENLFGFASTSNAEQPSSVDHRREFETTIYIDDIDENSTETTLAAEGVDITTDASLEPLVINDGGPSMADVTIDDNEIIENVNNISTETIDESSSAPENESVDESSATNIFDLSSEERSEIVRLVYANVKQSNP